eukprot:scaffold1699_cov114-Isochrysis_galbana.AAC.1
MGGEWEGGGGVSGRHGTEVSRRVAASVSSQPAVSTPLAAPSLPARARCGPRRPSGHRRSTHQMAAAPRRAQSRRGCTTRRTRGHRGVAEQRLVELCEHGRADGVVGDAHADRVALPSALAVLVQALGQVLARRHDKCECSRQCSMSPKDRQRIERGFFSLPAPLNSRMRCAPALDEMGVTKLQGAVFGKARQMNRARRARAAPNSSGGHLLSRNNTCAGAAGDRF